MSTAVFDTHFHIIDPRFAVMEDLIRDTVGDAVARKAFCDKAVAFYRPRELPRTTRHGES